MASLRAMTSRGRTKKAPTETTQPTEAPKTTKRRSKSPPKKTLEQKLYLQWFDTKLANNNLTPTTSLGYNKEFANLLLAKLPEPSSFTIDVNDQYGKVAIITIRCKTGREKDLEHAVRILSVEDVYLIQRDYGGFVIWTSPILEEQVLIGQEDSKFADRDMEWEAELQPVNPRSQTEMPVPIHFIDVLGWSSILPQLHKLNKQLEGKRVRIANIILGKEQKIKIVIIYKGDRSLVDEALKVIVDNAYTCEVIEECVRNKANLIFANPTIRSARMTLSVV